MLKRSKIYHKIEPEKEVKKVFIFCEGDREVNYFLYFKGFSSNIDIIPIPNNNGESDPEKLNQDAALKLLGTSEEKPKFNFNEQLGDEVWFVIDTDRWNEGDKIKNLRENCSKQVNWKVAQSNPCFEIWLYFHFHSTKPTEEDFQNISFKEFVHSKILGGFNSEVYPLYFQDAIKHSQINFETENNQPKYLSTEVHNLAECIIPFIKSVFDELIIKFPKRV